MEDLQHRMLDFSRYYLSHCRKSEGKRRKTQTTEGMVITEQEVGNRRVTINDAILVSTCIGHHLHYIDKDRLRMICLAREMPRYIYREGIHVVAFHHTA